MDSGNSGSLQSSSGGDEEYDSGFLNPTTHVASSSLFDPLSNYLDTYSRSPAAAPPSNLLNLDVVWSRGLRSEPTCTEIPIGGLMGSSSSSAQPVSVGQASSFQGLSSTSTVPLFTSAKNGAKLPGSSSSEQTNPVRNSKKRTRASRRAPTTVLTTDTSNFRAMVQEFTGIPAPPFSASPFSRSRFDLFGSTASTTMRSSHLDSPLPHYLLRPFAQKFNPPSSAPPSSFGLDVIASATNSTGNSGGAAISTAPGGSNNHQLLSDLGFTKQNHQSLLSMQNPMFTFQSLPPAPLPRYPLSNVAGFGAKSQGSLMVPSMDSSQLRMGTTTTGVEDFTIDRSSENVSSRGEGMVDSWICSSD